MFSLIPVCTYYNNAMQKYTSDQHVETSHSRVEKDHTDNLNIDIHVADCTLDNIVSGRRVYIV